MWSCRGFLISGHSQRSLSSDLGAGTHEDAVALETSSSSSSSSLFFSLGSFCYPVSFVCAAGNLNRDYTPPPQILKYAGDTFLGF